ncbi:MAG: sigma-70 family RNA polymerase sigma factor [Verrucomicrobiota bacterium]
MLPTTEISQDDEWLSAWVKRRDHAAFRALVGKYTGLVYGTALRRLGRADWAEEMVQEVFIVFARQSAGLRGAGGLAAWLHRAAAFKAAARLRAEIRHRGRMEKLTAMAPEPDAGDPEVRGTVPERDWALLRPLLDEAVASLPERDRRVILLHYFDHKTYPEVAALTGDSHEAARKRGARALEKLSRVLRRRGLALPAAAIGGGLSAAFQESAPATLLPLAAKAASAGIVAATMAGTGMTFLTTFSISSLFAMKTSLTAAVLVLAAGSSLVWWSRNHRDPAPDSALSVTAVPVASTVPPVAVPARTDLSSSTQKRAALTAVAGKPLPLPLPPPSAGPQSPPPPLDPALMEVFRKDPRTKKAELRVNALKGGFKGLLDLQLEPFHVKKTSSARPPGDYAIPRSARRMRPARGPKWSS